MTNTISNLGLRMAATLVVLLSATSAYGEPYGRFYVPFQFHMGDTLLPAGNYVVNIDPTCRRLELSSENGRTIQFLSANEPVRPAESAKPGQLVFHRYGNVYMLHRVWRHGAAAGHQMPVSKLEREMARQAETRPVTEIASLSGQPRL